MLNANDLADKMLLSNMRIQQWYDYWEGQVYVSFSGGKDSTVLLDLVRKMYPEVPAVFIDTGLEYPEIRDFVKTISNVEWIRPKMSFAEVISKYGFPVVSKEVSQKIYEIKNTKSAILLKKRLEGDAKGNGKLSIKWQSLISAPFKISDKCCDILKKNPTEQYSKITGRKPIIGTMAEDSRMRWEIYNRNGCNVFDSPHPTSKPISTWTSSIIWEYIRKNNLPYSKIYDMGAERTGCMFCAFGVHMEKKGENRFQRMARTHPRQYNTCMNKLGMKSVLEFLGVATGTDHTVNDV